MEEALDGLRGDDMGFSPDGDDPSSLEVRREAIRKVSEMQDRLEEMLNGEEAEMDESLRENLEGLNTNEMSDENAAALAEALQKGDFKKAQEALKKLAEAMSDDSMTQEEKENTAKQLEDLAKQLEELAKKQKSLEDALKKAGLDPDLAQNPEAMKKAIENAKNLNEQQKQQLQQQAQAQKAASQACQNMGGACQKMAQSMQQGQQGQQGQQQMSEMLSELEAMQQMLQQAERAASQCKGACEGLGEGLSQWAAALQSQEKKQGQGMGKWGAGSGGNAPISPTPSATVMEREKVEVRQGDIIARQLVEGEQVVGEAKQRLKEISSTISQGFEEGVSDDPIPPHLREVHKRYFGEVQKRIEARTRDSSASSSSEKKPASVPPSKPASGE